MPYVNLLVNTGTDASNSSKANSLGFLGNSLGSFAFAYVMAGIGSFIGGISEHQAFIYGPCWVALALIVVVAFSATQKKKA